MSGSGNGTLRSILGRIITSGPGREYGVVSVKCTRCGEETYQAARLLGQDPGSDRVDTESFILDCENESSHARNVPIRWNVCFACGHVESEIDWDRARNIWFNMMRRAVGQVNTDWGSPPVTFSVPLSQLTEKAGVPLAPFLKYAEEFAEWLSDPSVFWSPPHGPRDADTSYKGKDGKVYTMRTRKLEFHLVGPSDNIRLTTNDKRPPKKIHGSHKR
jgi:hypothetical protein